MGFTREAWEAQASQGYSFSSKSICPAHVDDAVLKDLIRERLSEESCSYCDKLGTADDPIAAAFDDFMDCFMVGVRHRFAGANDEGVPYEDGAYVGTRVYDSYEVAEEIFHEAIDHFGDDRDELLADINLVLLDQAWVRHEWQWLSQEQRLSYNWDAFKKLVKHVTRFLFLRWPSRRPDDPDEMSPLEFFEALANLLRGLPEVVSSVGATPLYRGRMKRTEPDIAEYSAANLGPPPDQEARANRMSPAGISMFYGASDIATAIAEIGAHSSDTWAVVGEFSAARELRVLDLSNLPRLPSIFVPGELARDRYDKVAFLRRFVEDLTLPVVLDGREHIDYVPTQVFTEYLRYSFPGRLDGLVFPSAQGPGRNYVIFYGAEFCSNPDDVGDYTRLILNPQSIQKYRVTTVIKPEATNGVSGP